MYILGDGSLMVDLLFPPPGSSSVHVVGALQHMSSGNADSHENAVPTPLLQQCTAKISSNKRGSEEILQGLFLAAA